MSAPNQTQGVAPPWRKAVIAAVPIFNGDYERSWMLCRSRADDWLRTWSRIKASDTPCAFNWKALRGCMRAIATAERAAVAFERSELGRLVCTQIQDRASGKADAALSPSTDWRTRAANR